MHRYNRSITTILAVTTLGFCQLSCKKMLNVPDPINSITTAQIFKTDLQGATAMAGVYTKMINGSFNFSDGLTTIMGSLSSDDLYCYSTQNLLFLPAGKNQLLNNDANAANFWSSAFTTIYGANSVIEGVAASTSGLLSDSARKELTGEAKVVRAFSYFYLTNFFGDVPLALTVDFNKTKNMARTPQQQVYRQIIQDLTDAQSLLRKDYSASNLRDPQGPFRILPNYWAATALLARTYLYTGDYTNAATQAAAVIGNSTLFTLESDPNNVFLPDSREAIWQLRQGSNDFLVQNCTYEGYNLLPNPLNAGQAPYCLTSQLLNAFEPGDKRFSSWVGATNNSVQNPTPVTSWYPFKYKCGTYNSAYMADPTEFYMMLRLGEMYLIKAEAEANGAAGGVTTAIADLNVLRARAGLQPLSASLTQPQVAAAVAHERQVELFAEWGHRWLDLKRTGQAHSVLSTIPLKQPWTGDYQLLYPLPPLEVQTDHNLIQNPGY